MNTTHTEVCGLILSRKAWIRFKCGCNTDFSGRARCAENPGNLPFRQFECLPACYASRPQNGDPQLLCICQNFLDIGKSQNSNIIRHIRLADQPPWVDAVRAIEKNYLRAGSASRFKPELRRILTLRVVIDVFGCEQRCVYVKGRNCGPVGSPSRDHFNHSALLFQSHWHETVLPGGKAVRAGSVEAGPNSACGRFDIKVITICQAYPKFTR